MASSNSAIINLNDDDLQFTESSSSTHTFNQAPDSAVDFDDEENDRAKLIGDESGDDGSGRRGVNRYNFWSIEFYQQFFDVDTPEVKERIVAAMIPRPGKSFLTSVLKEKPDLWGPVWICTTLVISVAVTGNLASYFQTAWQGETKDFVWHYDFHKVTLAATAVFSYAWFVPGALYGFLWWTASGSLAALSFLDLICLYGYSLAIYIPVSVLWLIQNNLLQWTLVLVGAGLSGGVLVFTLWPILKDNSNKSGVIIILIIVALHLLLACGFMLYFFHYPGSPVARQESIPSDSNSLNISNGVAKDSNEVESQKEEGEKDEEKEHKNERSIAEASESKGDAKGGGNQPDLTKKSENDNQEKKSNKKSEAVQEDNQV